MKRRATDWESTLANHISNKGLISRVYKKTLKTQQLKTKHLVGKWAKDMDRHFTAKYIQMANKNEEKKVQCY